MAGTPDQISSGIGAGEYRDPRFAELDGKIKVERAARQHLPLNGNKSNKQRRPNARLPASVRKEIARRAQELR